MGWPIDMEQKGCKSIGCYTHFVTFNVHFTHDLDLGFSSSNFENAVAQEWDGRLTWNERDFMVCTGLEKSWNLTLDLKSHGILCWPGKLAFCLEKSLKISGSHWKISCAMLNLIWTWKHWWLYDKSVTLSSHLRPYWWNHACRLA